VARVLGVLLASLALTPPLAEAPQMVLPGKSYGGCPGATGVPGEVAIESSRGVRFLQASREGLRVREELELGGDTVCPEVSRRANGVGVVAAQRLGAGSGDEVVATVRDPGGAWRPPVSLAIPEGSYVYDLDTAVADSGDAVVAWTERDAIRDAYRLRLARRPAGQAFGPAETIGPQWIADGVLEIGVAATGETFAMTATRESDRLPLHAPVRVAVAPRGEAFGAFTGLGLMAWRSQAALAVAQDGRALVAFGDGANVLVAERAPGEGFGSAAAAGAATDIVGVDADAALGTGGAAAVAWAGREEHAGAMVTRRSQGPFTPPVTVRARTPFTDDPFFVSQTFAAAFGIGSAFEGRDAGTLALTGDGHAALAGYRDDDVHGVFQLRASLTTVPLGGDRADTQILGGVLGLSGSASAISLTDGTPALVWPERIDASGTVHLAAQGATTPDEPPPPRVTVGAPVRRVVAPGEQLVLPVRCSGPCDVRGQALGGSRATGRLRLKRAGRGLLKLETGSVPLAPRRLGPVRIRLTYGHLDTQHPSTRIVTVRLERPTDPPRPRLVGLRAERRQRTIRVTWRVRHPDETAAYLVTGAATRDWSGEPPLFEATYTANGRGSFAVTLSPAGDDVRWVTLRSAARDLRVVVPVR
jgi:hypothetical protein